MSVDNIVEIEQTKNQKKELAFFFIFALFFCSLIPRNTPSQSKISALSSARARATIDAEREELRREEEEEEEEERGDERIELAPTTSKRAAIWLLLFGEEETILLVAADAAGLWLRFWCLKAIAPDAEDAGVLERRTEKVIFLCFSLFFFLGRGERTRRGQKKNEKEKSFLERKKKS